jgi:1,2-diacylglycerol-3-alpha-glucose alpha-1,2-glucosyltransferase
MRICLFLEAESAVAKSGFRRAYQSNIKALELAGIDVTTDPKDGPFDILHLHAWGPKSFLYLKRARRAGVKVVVHAHSVGAHDFRDSYTFSNLLSPLYEQFLKFVYAKADVIFTPTPFARRMLQQLGVEKPIHSISNGVDVSRFKFSEESRKDYRERLGLKRFTIFSAGLIIPRKGITEFLNIASKLPQYDFVWFGQRWSKAMAYHPKMDRHLENRPENAIMAGYVEEPQDAFCAADVLLFPSRTETQGMVMLEAAALGIPIVVRDLPEYEDWLIHDVNCLKANSLEEFADHIERLKNDRDLYDRLSKEAQNMVQDHQLEVIGEKLRSLYRSVMEKGLSAQIALTEST